MMLVWRAQKTLILRFGGFVLALELCTLAIARSALRDPALSLSEYRQIRIATLTSSLMAAFMAYPSLALVATQVELVPQPKMEEVFVRQTNVKRSGPLINLHPRLIKACSPDNDVTPSLVREQANEDIPAVCQNIEAKLFPGTAGAYNQDYEGLHTFYADSLVGNICAFIDSIWRMVGRHDRGAVDSLGLCAGL